MLSFDNAAAIAAAPSTASLDPALQKLLTDRVHDWAATDLLGLTHLVIVQPGDTEADIDTATGYSPLVNPLDGSRYGSPLFVPPFDWLQQHGRWTELIQMISNDGWALVLFLDVGDGADPALRSLCKEYAAEFERGDRP